MEILRAPPSSNQCTRSEEHTSELQSQSNLVCRLLLEKKKVIKRYHKVLLYQSLKALACRNAGIRRPRSVHIFAWCWRPEKANREACDRAVLGTRREYD